MRDTLLLPIADSVTLPEEDGGMKVIYSLAEWSCFSIKPQLDESNSSTRQAATQPRHHNLQESGLASTLTASHHEHDPKETGSAGASRKLTHAV